MSVTVRFAPSPTGRLHIGNVRTALLNWLFARKEKGIFLLRLDDTDRERSTAAFAAAIREDLRWLGLSWMREERQSERAARYEECAEELKRAGRLYPCYESAEELERRRKLQLARGLPPIYDRSALHLTAGERAGLEAQGRRPHWRFRLANSDPARPDAIAPTLVYWDDLVRGEQAVDLGSLSDPVVIREDGTFLYTFTSVVDDADFGISHVIRGEDHVTNTAVQLQLFEALGALAPRFAHHSLLVGRDGRALSKSEGATSIAGMRERGLEAMAVASYAALVGTSLAIAPHRTLDELAELFSFASLSRAPGRFEDSELEALNVRLLHTLPYEDVKARLEQLGVGGGPEFWQAVRGNIAVLADAERWWTVVASPLRPVITDGALCAVAAELLPAEPWDEATWESWIAALKARTQARGKALFHPLRLALTAAETGPELKALLPFIGRERARVRLLGRMG
jgi:glutamyl-tRNA synthetase